MSALLMDFRDYLAILLTPRKKINLFDAAADESAT
jgi:hypothetical protein